MLLVTLLNINLDPLKQDGWTPLMIASAKGTDILQVLIEAKAQINTQKEV